MVYASVLINASAGKVKLNGPPELLAHVGAVGVVNYLPYNSKEVIVCKFNYTPPHCETVVPNYNSYADIDVVPLLNILEARGWHHVSTTSIAIKFSVKTTMYFNKPT